MKLLGYSFNLLLISLFVISCAKPNYQDPVAAANNKPPANDEKPTDPNKPPAQTDPNKPKACEIFFTQKRLCLDFKWKQKNVGEQLGLIELKFYIQETPQTFVDPELNVAVVLWMPSMGHGSTPVEVTKIKTGEYEASNVFFIMPGEWEVRVQLKKDKEVVDQVVQKVTH